MTKKHNLFYLILIVCSLTMHAQKKLQSQAEKETQEYLEYMQKIMRFENLKAKGDKTSDIPRPLGLDPSVSRGGVSGNAKSWELYHKTIGNLSARQNALHNTASKSSKNVASKMPRVVNEKEKPRKHINDAAKNAQLITNFGTGKNQSRKIVLKGAIVQKGVIGKPTVFKKEKENNDAFSIANTITIGSKETVRMKGSLKNRMKNNRLSGDVDVYDLNFKKGKHYVLEFENSGDEILTIIVKLFFEDGTDKTYATGDPKKNLLFPADLPRGKVKLAVYSSEIFIRKSQLEKANTVYSTSKETTYKMTWREKSSATYKDKDFYKIKLKKGDVIGITGKSEFLLDYINLKNLAIFYNTT